VFWPGIKADDALDASNVSGRMCKYLGLPSAIAISTLICIRSFAQNLDGRDNEIEGGFDDINIGHGVIDDMHSTRFKLTSSRVDFLIGSAWLGSRTAHGRL
jgi:hypothetical protein